MIPNPEIFKPLYSSLLKSIQKNHTENICTFFPQVGENYFSSNYRILFVGKALNGCNTYSRNVDELFDPKFTDTIVNNVGQMKWVKCFEGRKHGYNTNKSAFWRVIREIAKQKMDTKDWYKFVAWSNLYKLSPEVGNPSKLLMKAQEKDCIKILTKELEVLKPNAIIYLTSRWEWFFINTLEIDKSKRQIVTWGKRKHRTASFYHNKILHIQSVHPQGKKESCHVNVIIDIINRKNESQLR